MFFVVHFQNAGDFSSVLEAVLTDEGFTSSEGLTVGNINAYLDELSGFTSL